jgi:hypothetical protein
MKFNALLCGTGLATLAMLSTPALADTTVATTSTTPLKTSTAGNVTVTEEGELAIASGTAITVDSSSTITNDGDIIVASVDNAVGIRILPGVSTTIINNGLIELYEDFTPADEDLNAIADGAVALRSNRFGIYGEAGGTITGSIDNNGSILVEGLNSGGIVLDSRLDGSLSQDAYVQVIGDNAVGIRTRDVTGDISLEGSTSVFGDGASALVVNGSVGGVIRLQGTVRQLTSYTFDDGDTLSLSRFALRNSTPTVAIAGNVAGGIVVAAPPADDSTTDTDEDDDGVADTDEGTGNVISYGNGPAIRIGGATDTVIGTLPAATGGYSLLIEGAVSGTATYSRTDAFGVVIGGQGGNVSLPGGIGVTGSLTATTQDSAATALLINAGSTVTVLDNSGSITATISSQGEGEAYAIRDLSGSLTTIENTGYITATGSSTDIVRAIDLSAATSDVTITQYMNADDIATRKEVTEDLDEGETDTTVYTSITGNIVTGSGNDTLSVDAGRVTGTTFFNAGNDRLLLTGEAVYTGKVLFGTGQATANLSGDASFTGTIDFAGLAGNLAISDTAEFRGTITNGRSSVIDVTGGSFGADGVKTFSIGTLNVGASGVINVYVDGATQTSSVIDATKVVLADGASVSATVNSLATAGGTYTVVTASSITGTAAFNEQSTDLPFIYTGSVSQTANALTLELRRKTATEVGLNASGASAYDAILTAALADDIIAQSFLDITDGDSLKIQIAQMLPDHSGGIFDSLTRSTRLAAQHIMDNDSFHDYSEPGTFSVWLEPLGWRSTRKAGVTSGYTSQAFGISGGAEWLTTLGYFGGSYAWMKGKVTNNGGTGEIDTSQHDVAVHWRTGRNSPLLAYARIGAAYGSFDSTRTLTFTATDADYSYSSVGDWKGWMYSGIGGVSYDIWLGRQLNLRPKLGLEWFRLSEDGYAESGGDDSVDLTVGKRTSTALNNNASLALAYSIAPPGMDYLPLTFELEGGRRSLLSGTPGATTATFTDGESFSIAQGQVDSAWTGQFSIYANGWDYSWKLAAGAEKSTNSDINYSGRVSLSVAF